MKLVFPQFLQFEHVFTGFTLTAQFRSAMAYFQIKSNVCWTFWDESQLLNLFTSKFWHLLCLLDSHRRKSSLIRLTNLLDHIFIFISQIKQGMKWLIISIAWIAQMVERKVTTLKVKGSILLSDRILFLIIVNFKLLEKEFYRRGEANPQPWGS